MKHIKKFNESNSIIWDKDEVDDIDEMFISVKDDCNLSKKEWRDGVQDRNEYTILNQEGKVVIIIKTCGTIPTTYDSYRRSPDMDIDKQTYFDVKEHVEEFIKQLKLNGYTVEYKELGKHMGPLNVFVRCGIRLEISK